MSDVRAIVRGRGIAVGDGAYHERLDVPILQLEEVLRSALARVPLPQERAAAEFIRRTGALESAAVQKDDDALRIALRQLAAGLRQHGFRDDLVAQAFAFVREASRRTLGMRHYDVQLLAGRALLAGKIAEMATGEGKTLAATLAACSAAASGAAVHVVTVNDYLAERDAHDNSPLYAFFGLAVGVVLQDMAIADRRAQYACDVVYVSNKELTFDYLKDRLALGASLRAHRKLRLVNSPSAASPSVLRGLHVAIVDEADSVLIDEARTPLIISRTLPADLDVGVYEQAISLAQSLETPKHYLVSAHRDTWLTAAGKLRVAELCAELHGVWTSTLWQRDLVQTALSALHLFQRDRHYIIADGKIQIVDEFTGRVMPDRTWEGGLHQMIEAKERCEISGQRKTLAQITYQRFFARYLLLGGMTGTAREVAPELKRVYDLSVVGIPTHKPSRRRRLPDRVFATSAERWQEVARRAGEIAAAGRAVLVGTRSVEASELLGRLLDGRAIAHTLLNARQDKSEADAVAQAGHAGRITVATNMAGRGTDIKLAADVAEQGGLHVILTEFHESARIDRQLFGRAARQGDPGSVEAIVCLQDELFARYARQVTRLCGAWCLGDSTRAKVLLRTLVRFAQWRAESRNRHIRLETTKRDRQWLKALGFVGMAKK